MQKPLFTVGLLLLSSAFTNSAALASTDLEEAIFRTALADLDNEFVSNWCLLPHTQDECRFKRGKENIATVLVSLHAEAMTCNSASAYIPSYGSEPAPTDDELESIMRQYFYPFDRSSNLRCERIITHFFADDIAEYGYDEVYQELCAPIEQLQQCLIDRSDYARELSNY